MPWRDLLNELCADWPEEHKAAHMAEVAETNDHAERLGYECHLDDRLPIGNCYFTKDGFRVWFSIKGWHRARFVDGVLSGYTWLYHTFTQSLANNGGSYAYLDSYGRYCR